MLSLILGWAGITMDVVTRDEAALDLLGRTYRLKWSPVIITDPPEQGRDVVSPWRRQSTSG